MRTQPLRGVGRRSFARDGVDRDDAAIADLSGEPGIVRAEERGAHPRMDAVGADDDVGLDLAAILETRHCHVTVRVDRRAALAQGDAVGGQRSGDHVEQVGAVYRRAAEPKRRGLLRSADLRDQSARPPVVRRRPLRATRDPAHRVLHPDHPQHPHRVGMQRHAGADLLELWCRLIDRHLQPCLRQRTPGRRTADPAPMIATRVIVQTVSSPGLSRTRRP